MNIFNLMKKASIGLGLLLIPSFIVINYQIAEAGKAGETKTEKTNEKHKKETSKKSDNQSKDNNKSSKNVSEKEKTIVRNMYNDFQNSISNGVTIDNVSKFYKDYFSPDTYKSFGIKKHDAEAFNKALIDYCVNVLKSNLGQIAKGYEIPKSAEFNKTKKNRSRIIKCKLEKDNEKIDMSVTLNKDNKIKDVSIMNVFQLIKGAKTVVEEYCRTNKNKEYKKLKPKEKLEMCQKAWQAHFNKINKL